VAGEIQVPPWGLRRSRSGISGQQVGWPVLGSSKKDFDRLKSDSFIGHNVVLWREQPGRHRAGQALPGGGETRLHRAF